MFRLNASISRGGASDGRGAEFGTTPGLSRSNRDVWSCVSGYMNQGKLHVSISIAVEYNLTFNFTSTLTYIFFCGATGLFLDFAYNPFHLSMVKKAMKRAVATVYSVLALVLSPAGEVGVDHTTINCKTTTQMIKYV